MTLSFIALGVGDAFSARHYSTCFAVGFEDRWLLVDCPHPIRKILKEAVGRSGVRLDIADFDAVVLTHLHGDHASGLEGLGYFSRFALGRPARLVTHPAVRERLWAGHLAAGMEQLVREPGAAPTPMSFCDYFETTPLYEGEPLELGPFTLECRLTVHHVPTTALRIRAGGRCLGLSADTAFDPGLVDWLAEADLVVHETNHGPAHTPYEKLLTLPEATRAKMRLVHYPDEHDVASSAIPCLEQGERVLV